jgi:hypothetical protein
MSGGQKATASKDFFNVTERLIDGLLADIKPKVATLDASSPEFGRKTSTAFFLAKAFKTYRAINVLVEHQYHQDAAVLARTIHEILLQILYVSGAVERGELFLKHDPVDRYYLYLKLSKYPDLVEGIANRVAELEKLKDQFDELESDYRKNKGWWGSDLRSLAESLGSEKAYLRVYPLYSALVHSTSTSVKHYVQEIDHRLELDIGPSELGRSLAGFEIATSLVLLVAHATAAAWDLATSATELLAEAQKIGQPDPKQ